MAETAKPTTKAISSIDAVYNTLQAMAPQFEMALPSQVPSEKFIRAMRTTIQLNPKLLDCDRTSLYAESMKAAQDGLVLDGREATLVPFKGVAKYMPMVLGLCKKARNSGEIESLDAFDVFANDTYDSWVDEKGQHFNFRRAKADRGEYILTAAYAITNGGGFFFEEVDKEQMDAIEKSSRSDTGPWTGPFRGEMRRKSALRRLLKYRVPSSSDLDSAMMQDIEKEDAAPKTEEKAPEVKRPERASAIVEAHIVDNPVMPSDDNNEVPI